MTRSTPLLALVLALPLAIPLACSDDSIDVGSGGSGSTGTLATTGTNTGSTGTSTATDTGAGGDTSGTAGGSTTTNSGGGNVGGAGSGGDTGSSTGVGGVQPPTEIAECQGHVYECGDLIDNDGDGLLDNLDPDCLGPCDDTEDSYFGGISGQSGPPCKVDCYFDQDSGPGNDDCHWDHRCDPYSVDPNYYPEPENGAACEYEGPDYLVNPGQSCGELLTEQSEACQAYCAPLVPNGCDCFGCCELPAGSGSFVWLGSEGGVNEDGSTKFCDIENVSNPAVCHPCTPVQDECYNPCGECELCIGKTIEDLPAHCFPGGEGGGDPSGAGGSGSTTATGTTTSTTTGSGGGSSSSGGGSQCPDGIQACGLPGQPACDAGEYCVTGCCRTVPN